jgi:transposase
MSEQFVGIDWATRRARWCAVTPTGAVIDEGWTPADEDGLAILVGHLGPDAVACLEMMSGAAWVRDQLTAAGWTVQIADARKAKAVGSLAAKTDKLDARVLAELARRDLVPQVHVPTFADRELKERLGRRMHMVRLRTAAMNRAHGVLSQFGVTLAFKRLREPDRDELLVERGVPDVWRRSIAEAVAVVAILDLRLIPLEQELRPLARADSRGSDGLHLREPVRGTRPPRATKARSTKGALPQRDRDQEPSRQLHRGRNDHQCDAGVLRRACLRASRPRLE